MRISKWMKCIAFIAVVAGVNMLMSFLYEPANGASSRMWAGYYSEEKIDTIFVGSSLCQQTFIPSIFDEKMGVKSYNMGTPSQAVPQTMRAIEVAVEEHDIKTIVYAMGFSSLKHGPIKEAEMTFESARTREKGGIEGMFEMLGYMYSEDVIAEEKSINFLFPWTFNNEGYTREDVEKNVAPKLKKLKEYIKTGKIDKTDGLQKGFRNDDKSVFNYDNRWTVNTDRFYNPDFNMGMLAEFELLLKFCYEKGIELIVINTPHPIFDVVTCYEYYEENERQIKEYCQRYNADYYDFSLAKSEIYEIKGTHFCDYEHLNKQGAKDFCEKLSDFLLRREEEDMDAYFYSVDEFLEIHAEELKEWKESK